MTGPQLHPNCEPLAFLLGVWRGEGHGLYPTVSDFAYGEELHFWHVGRPHLLYSQKTWSLATSDPMHSEMGYWRPGENGALELVLAHPLGIAEVQEGRVDRTKIELTSTGLIQTATAKKVEGLARVIEVDGDTMRCELAMAFGEHSLRPHLSSELRRVS